MVTNYLFNVKYHLTLYSFIFFIMLNSVAHSSTNDLSIENRIDVKISEDFSANVQQEFTIYKLNEENVNKIDTRIELQTNHSIEKISTNQGSISNYYVDSKFLYIVVEELHLTKTSPLKIYINYSIDKIVKTENDLNYFDFGYKFGDASFSDNYLVNMNIIFPYGLNSSKDKKYFAYFGLPTYDKNLSVGVRNKDPLIVSVLKNTNSNTGNLLFRFIFILYDKPSMGVVLKDKPSLNNNKIESSIELTNVYNVSNIYYRFTDNQFLIFDETSPYNKDTKPRNKLGDETIKINDIRKMDLIKCSWIYNYIYPFECYSMENSFNIGSYFDPNINPIDFVFDHNSDFRIPNYYILDKANSFILNCPQMISFPPEFVRASKRGFDIYSAPISGCVRSNFTEEESIEGSLFKSNINMPLHYPQYTTIVETHIQIEKNPIIIIISFILAILPIFWLYFIRYYSKTKNNVRRSNKYLHYGGMIIPILTWIVFYLSFFDINKILYDLIFWVLFIIIIAIIYLEFAKTQP